MPKCCSAEVPTCWVNARRRREPAKKLVGLPDSRLLQTDGPHRRLYTPRRPPRKGEWLPRGSAGFVGLLKGSAGLLRGSVWGLLWGPSGDIYKVIFWGRPRPPPKIVGGGGLRPPPPMIWASKIILYMTPQMAPTTDPTQNRSEAPQNLSEA